MHLIPASPMHPQQEVTDPCPQQDNTPMPPLPGKLDPNNRAQFAPGGLKDSFVAGMNRDSAPQYDPYHQRNRQDKAPFYHQIQWTQGPMITTTCPLGPSTRPTR